MAKGSFPRRGKSGDTKAGEAKYGETNPGDTNTTSRLRSTNSGRITKPEKTAAPTPHKAAARERSKSRRNVHNEQADDEDIDEEVEHAGTSPPPFAYIGIPYVDFGGEITREEYLAHKRQVQMFNESHHQIRLRPRPANDTETVGAAADAQAGMIKDNAARQNSTDEMLLDTKDTGIAAGEEGKAEPDKKRAHIAEGNKVLNDVQQLLSTYLARSRAGSLNGIPGSANTQARASRRSPAEVTAVLDAARANGILNSTHQTLYTALALLNAASPSAVSGPPKFLAGNIQTATTPAAGLNAEVTAPRSPETPRECPVCLESLGVTSEPEEVCRKCGFVIHTQCRARQHDYDRANNRPRKCLNCQQAWAGSRKVILVE
ncbi:Hypothetical predicted protein [Lecanosticta acicola]|uniref:RING-type domain-containing protein n=1 Tax=Lecanosticta acicola TaxID=111012 RepID=A0AAI9ECS6_9PEZI|nr:Hypothetical predicted protein [Lecanosticta acicola]